MNISRNKNDQIASKGPNRLRESEEFMRTHNPHVVYIFMVMVVYGNWFLSLAPGPKLSTTAIKIG